MGYRRWFRLHSGRREDVERELDDEIEAHIALRVEGLIARGDTPEAARAEALRRFGDPIEAKRRLRETVRMREGALKRSELGDGIRRDVKLAFRQARSAPGFAALTVVAFALGIGLTTLMFTIVDRVLLRALPFPRAEQLVALLSVDSAGGAFARVSMANWLDWQDQSSALAGSALLRDRTFTLVASGEAFRVPGATVAGPFFEVLGTRMLVGRPFTADEVQTSAAVAVVSERFWRARMGASTALGTILVDGNPMEVVGVLPRGRGHPMNADLWIGEVIERRTGNARNWINYAAIARLRDGVSVDRARVELSGVAQRIRAEDPVALYSYGVGVLPLQQLVVEHASGSLILLMGSVTFVLLVACANIAGLALARAHGRNREIALRMAIGAGRGRVLQQLITELLVLATAGGLLGIGLAWWSMRSLVALAGNAIPRALEIGLDARVLAVALLATFLTGLLCAMGPALKAANVPLRTLIGSDRAARGGRNLPGALLVAAEVALALVLLTGGAALIRSYRAVIDRDLGYDARGVLTAEIVLASPRYREEPSRRLLFWETLLEHVRATTGADAVSVANWVPAGYGGVSFVQSEGSSDDRRGAGYRVVSDAYFHTIGVPLLSGRMFESTDGFGTERVAVVNRTLAERFWPGEDPLDKRLRASSMEGEVPGGAPWLRVIGVVDDIRHFGYESEPGPELFVLYRQLHTSLTSSMALVVRTPPERVNEVQRALPGVVRSIDPALATEVSPLEARIGSLVATRRLVMALLTVFSALALLLSAIGIYGLVSFAVAQRTREIGVRAALGARQSGILRLMLWSALRVVLAGAAVGVAGAFALTRLMQSMLFEVQAGDPLSFALALLVLLLASSLAALMPSVRAARLDPLAALRQM